MCNNYEVDKTFQTKTAGVRNEVEILIKDVYKIEILF